MNFHKDNKAQPNQMIKMGSMGKRYFGEPTGPLNHQKIGNCQGRQNG